jgi:hypothetical protein
VAAPAPRRALLCSEAWQGRGHVTTLATVARALAPLWRSQGIIAQVDHADVLASVCDRVDRGMHLAPPPDAIPSPSLNWGGWLRMRGFGDPALLRWRFDWWVAALDAIRPALVVADFAPTALLAARARGIPSVVTGAAFSLPPATLARFPDLLSAAEEALQGAARPPAPPIDEDALRDSINTTLVPLGLPPLARLPEVFAADLSLPRGVAIWDPYDGLRDRPLLMPVAELPPLQRQPGAEVFIYFSTSELDDPATRAALLRLPYPATLAGLRLTEAQARDLSANPRITVAPALLPPAEIVRRARVIVCAGQAGTLALSVLAGVPVLALPAQHEQLSNALRAAAALGGVRVLPKARRSAEAILDTIAELWTRPAPAAAARLMAPDLRAAYVDSALDSFRRLLGPLLDPGR